MIGLSQPGIRLLFSGRSPAIQAALDARIDSLYNLYVAAFDGFLPDRRFYPDDN